MCSRFEQNSTSQEIAGQFSLDEPPPVANRPEFRPTDQILVIDRNRQAVLRRWGIPAPWDGSPVFNARSETVREKPLFRDFLDGRCLIPASAWFEWRKDGTQKHKMRIAPTDAASTPMALAGLCNADVVTILTAAAIPSLADIHGRMPVILNADEIDRWLDLSQPLTDVVFLLKPHDVGGLAGEFTPVEPSRKIDSAQPDLFG